MFKVDTEDTRTRYETCLKLKLKINTPERHCQTVFCCLYLLPGSNVFIVDFEHLNDGWECCVFIFAIAIQVTINGPESVTRVYFYSGLPEHSEKIYNSISGISEKNVSLKFSSSK